MRIAFALLSLAAASAAQHSVVLPAELGRHGDIVATARGLTLPAGEFTIAEMIDATAGYLCRNYIFDRELVEQRRSFVLQRGLSLDRFGSEEVLYALLAARDLAALPLDELRGVYQIVPIGRVGGRSTIPMASIPWRRPQDILQRPNYRELVLTTITLHNLDAREVANALRSHFALQRQWRPGAPMVSSAGQRSLVLHGYGDQVGQTIRALREIDRANSPPTPTASDPILQRLQALEAEVARLRRLLAEKR